MVLWKHWFDVLWLLRPAFSRLRTFLWFAAAVAGLTVRTESLGVSSIVRALKLQPRLYNKLLEHFHSSAIKLDCLTARWAQTVRRCFHDPVLVNGRLVLVGDGIKIPKCGRKMPAVKRLHQQSGSNTKPQYIMGHSLQAVSLLVNAAKSVLAVPLAARIHEGVVWSNRDRRTLLDKMLHLLGLTRIEHPFYFVADAYYATGKIVDGLIGQDNHLITRVKSNAVAYYPYHHDGPRKPGRPKVYGHKIALKSLLQNAQDTVSMPSPVYGETQVTIRYRVCDLLWRPVGRLVRFVAVKHPWRGSCVLMCTDRTLEPADIIRLYGLRFKIEHSFKQAVRLIGSFSYHFWMKAMKPIGRKSADQYMHRQSPKYRQGVQRKLNAYHAFIQAGIVCQGLLQYLSSTLPDLVWKSFGSWLRTIRPGIPPSELVVAHALRQSMPEFLLNASHSNCLAKFIFERQDKRQAGLFRMAS